MKATTLLSKQQNKVLEYVDGTHFHALQNLRKKLSIDKAYIQGFDAVDSLMQCSRMVLFNKQMGNHLDLNDGYLCWADLFGAGDHIGGHVVFEQLNLKVRLHPGDFIKVRGRGVVHRIDSWKGQRVSIVSFTHQSIWSEMDMEDNVNWEALEKIVENGGEVKKVEE